MHRRERGGTSRPSSGCCSAGAWRWSARLDPAVAGYLWRQWLDEPGEHPPFARGLVHLDGAEAREHTELLAEFNARAEKVRCAVRLAVAEKISA